MYNDRASREPNTDAAGVADDGDIRVYHHIRGHIRRDTYGGAYTQMRHTHGGDTHEGAHTWRDIHTEGHIHEGIHTRRDTHGGIHTRRDTHTERPIHGGTHTWRDKHMEEHIHGGDMHMKGYIHGGTYTRKDIHAEGTYTRRGHTHGGTYIRGGHIHEGAHTWRDTYTKGYIHGGDQLFASISRDLVSSKRLDRYTQCQWFLQGLPETVLTEIFYRYDIDLEDDINFDDLLEKTLVFIRRRKWLADFIKENESDWRFTSHPKDQSTAEVNHHSKPPVVLLPACTAAYTVESFTLSAQDLAPPTQFYTVQATV